MIKKYTFLLVLILIITISCDNTQKNDKLAEREAELQKKEKLFAEKESEYQALLKMRDSIFMKKDSVKIVL